MNQKIIINNKKMTIDNAMQEFVKSFIVAIENDNSDLLLEINLKNFVGE